MLDSVLGLEGNHCFISGIPLSTHFHCTGEQTYKQTVKNGPLRGCFARGLLIAFKVSAQGCAHPGPL